MESSTSSALGSWFGGGVVLPGADVDATAQVPGVVEHVPRREVRRGVVPGVDGEGLGPQLAVPPAREGVPVVVLDHRIAGYVVAAAVERRAVAGGIPEVVVVDVVGRRVVAVVLERIRRVLRDDVVVDVRRDVIARARAVVVDAGAMMNQRVVDQVHGARAGGVPVDVYTGAVMSQVARAHVSGRPAQVDAVAAPRPDDARRQDVNPGSAADVVGVHAVAIAVQDRRVLDGGRRGTVEVEAVLGVLHLHVVHRVGAAVVEPDAVPHARIGIEGVGGEDHRFPRPVEAAQRPVQEADLGVGGARPALHPVRVGGDQQLCPRLERHGNAVGDVDVAEDRVRRSRLGEREVLPDEALDVRPHRRDVIVGADVRASIAEPAVGGPEGQLVVPVGHVGVQGVPLDAGGRHRGGPGVVAAGVTPGVGVVAVERGVVVAVVEDTSGAVVGYRAVVQVEGDVVRAARPIHLDTVAGVVVDGEVVEGDRAGPGGVPVDVDTVVSVVVNDSRVVGHRRPVEIDTVRAVVVDVGVVDIEVRYVGGVDTEHVAVEGHPVEPGGALIDVDARVLAIVNDRSRHHVVVVVKGNPAVGVGQVHLRHVERLCVGGDHYSVPVARRRGGRRGGELDRVGVGPVRLQRALDPDLYSGAVEAALHDVRRGDVEHGARLEGHRVARGDDHVAADVGRRVDPEDLVLVPEAVDPGPRHRPRERDGARRL